MVRKTIETKIEDVIFSCVTPRQIEVASRFVEQSYQSARITSSESIVYRKAMLRILRQWNKEPDRRVDLTDSVYDIVTEDRAFMSTPIRLEVSVAKSDRKQEIME